MNIAKIVTDSSSWFVQMTQATEENHLKDQVQDL